MNASVREPVVLDAEPPEALPANLNVGGRLLASSIVFFFMAFVFAFFYLRALNTAHSFLMPHVDPPVGWGVAILACVLGATVIVALARRQLGDGTESAWRRASLVAFLLALAAIALQLIEYYNLTFGAADGGLASVFFGFTAVYGVLWLGAVYWIETLWAESIRQPHTAPSDGSKPGRLLRPSADACFVYLATMAIAELFAFVLLYLVK